MIKVNLDLRVQDLSNEVALPIFVGIWNDVTDVYTEATGILKDGFVTVDIDSTETSGVYILVSGAHILPSWSANKVSAVNGVIDYDFTSVNAVYGNNVVEVESGVFGLFAGDTNQDGVIDGVDTANWDNVSLLKSILSYNSLSDNVSNSVATLAPIGAPVPSPR